MLPIYDSKIIIWIKPDGAIPNGLELLKQKRIENEITNLVEDIDVNEDEDYDSDLSVEL